MQKNRNDLKHSFFSGPARVLCYALGPVSGFLFLFSRVGNVWSVRFHAFHSILMTGLWAAAWSVLRIIEEVSPWFLGVVVRQLRFTMNLGFLLIWGLLLITAYGGSRCAVIPFVHQFAVRAARKSDRWRSSSGDLFVSAWRDDEL